MHLNARILIVGASGVIGAAVVEKFAAEGFEVVALSRRRPTLSPSVSFHHLSVDLTDRVQCARAVDEMRPVTHMVYAAVAEAPGLRDGWTDPALIALNRQMFANIADPIARTGGLSWLGLLQGTKAYGAHLHPIELPAREDRPRDAHANFYWEQEDHLRDLAEAHGFGWTIFRPQIVFGGAPGAVMNPVLAIGAYAAICRELALPFVYPARHALMWEVTDAALLAAAQHWAAQSPAASNQIFNVTNGDVFVLRDAWPHLAAALGLQVGEPQAFALADFFARETSVAAWGRLVRRHDLQAITLPAFLGQSQHYVDLLLDSRVIEAGGLPTLVSAIKLRKAGFTECCDSLESLLFWLRRMGEVRLLPRDLL